MLKANNCLDKVDFVIASLKTRDISGKAVKIEDVEVDDDEVEEG